MPPNHEVIEEDAFCAGVIIKPRALSIGVANLFLPAVKNARSMRINITIYKI